MKCLGNSPNWEKERFSMDEDMSRSVSECFIRLYEQRIIYKGK